MARIKIEDLPVADDLTPEKVGEATLDQSIFGATR